jgi:AcrR family transcriptional regulator
VAAAGGAPGANRLDRRKARTRQALIDAAVRLIAEGRGGRASIAEITEEADIGFGSFYNHFDSKEQLFGTASGELLEQWGQVIDQACADISDPAKVFAVSLRIAVARAAPGRVDESSVDQLTEACLRLLGVPGFEAARLVASCLPPVGAISR